MRMDVVTRVLEVAVTMLGAGISAPRYGIGGVTDRLAAGARPLGLWIEDDPVLVEVAQRLLVRLGPLLGLAAERVLGLVPRPHRGSPASACPCALYASTQRV